MHELPFLSHISAARLRRFTRVVELDLREADLRYSQRLALIRAAARLGIRRFDANLIIAAIQNREKQTACPAPAPMTRSRVGRILSSEWAIAGVVQAMLVAAAWWALAA